MNDEFKKLLDDWLKLAISKRKLYLELAELEINNQTKSKRFKEIRNLLQSCHEFEQDKIKKINISSKNINQIRNYLLKDNFLVSLDNIDTAPTEKYHIANHLEQAEVDFIKDENISSINDLIKVLNGKERKKDKNYSNEFENIIIRNSIKTIDLFLPFINDDKLKKHLIKYKYTLIYITPNYEELFLTFKNYTLPEKNIHDIEKTSCYSKEEIINLNIYNIKSFVIEYIKTIQAIPEERIFEETIMYYIGRLFISIAAYIISIPDYQVYMDICIEIEKCIVQNDIINKHITYLLEQTFNVINNIQDSKQLLNKKEN